MLSNTDGMPVINNGKSVETIWEVHGVCPMGTVLALLHTRSRHPTEKRLQKALTSKRGRSDLFLGNRFSSLAREWPCRARHGFIYQEFRRMLCNADTIATPVSLPTTIVCFTSNARSFIATRLRASMPTGNCSNANYRKRNSMTSATAWPTTFRSATIVFVKRLKRRSAGGWWS